MAGRTFTRRSNGKGNRITAEHVNELQVALEDDDARIDEKPDLADVQGVVQTELSNNATVVAAAESAAAAAVDANPTIATHTAAIARGIPATDGSEYQYATIIGGVPTFVDRPSLNLRWFYDASDNNDWAPAMTRMLAAMNHLVGQSGIIPSGDYPIKSTVQIADKMGLKIVGDGSQRTQFLWQGPADGIMFQVTGVRNSLFEGFSLVGDGKTTTGITQDGRVGGFVATENVWRQVTIQGHRFGARFGSITHFQADQTKFDRCRFSGCIEVAASLEDANSVEVNFYDTEFIGNGKSISATHFTNGGGGTGGAFNAFGCAFVVNTNWDLEVYNSSRGCALVGNLHEMSSRTLSGMSGSNAVTITMQECSVNGIAYAELFTPPASGTFTLTYKGQTTPALAFDAAWDTIQDALVALSTIGAGEMRVTPQRPGQPLVISRYYPLESDQTPVTTSAGTIAPINAHLEFRSSGSLNMIGGQYRSGLTGRQFKFRFGSSNNRRSNVNVIGTVFDGDPFKGAENIAVASIHLTGVQFARYPTSTTDAVGNVSGPLTAWTKAVAGPLGGNNYWYSAVWLYLPTGTAFTAGVNTFIGGTSYQCAGKTNVRVELSNRMGGLTIPVTIVGEDDHANVTNQFKIHVIAGSAFTLTSSLVFRVVFEPEWSGY